MASHPHRCRPTFRATTQQDKSGGIRPRRVGVSTLYIEPGSPWENGYVESFNGKLRDELLDREVFYTLLEVQVLTEQYRQTHNRISPHSSLCYRPLAPEVMPPTEPGSSSGHTNIQSGTTTGGRSLMAALLGR